MGEEITLDIIPIYKNKMYPTKDMIYYTKTKLNPNRDKSMQLEIMLQQIKCIFNNYDTLIILEKGIVIEIL